ncbi:MAG: hypothetical protein NTY19_29260 [Planctomycetota bacterium]|nr:hypothetical protein [Planctomycetota bacterium]
MSAKPGFSNDDDEDRELDADDELDEIPPLEADLLAHDEFANDDFEDFDDEFDDDFEEQLEDEYGLATDEDLGEEVLAEEEITNVEFVADFEDEEEEEEEEILPFVADENEDDKAQGKAKAAADEETDEDVEDDA